MFIEFGNGAVLKGLNRKICKGTPTVNVSDFASLEKVIGELMVKLAIMGAMEEEIEPLLSHFENVKVTEYAKNKYYELTYNGLEIVVAYSKIGKVFASLTASTLIQKFGCDTLFIFWCCRWNKLKLKNW